MFRYPWGTSEDDLTGDFFGLMKYLPEDALLVPFLSLIQSHYPDRNIAYRNIESAEILLWPEYQIPGQWREQFNRPDMPVEKRRSKYYIVPDVVIHLDECTLVVEAEKSHSVEAEQLFQQYLMGRQIMQATDKHKSNLFNLLLNIDQMPPYSCRVTATDTDTGISISPSDSIPRYIEKRAKMVGETRDLKEISHSFLWISWHHIGKLAEETLDIRCSKGDETSKVSTRFLSGLKEMMDKEGFYPAKVFRADAPSEIQIDDYSSIPVLHVIPGLKRIIDYGEAIEPSLIPTFHLLGYPVNWLMQQSIQLETIPVLRKES